VSPGSADPFAAEPVGLDRLGTRRRDGHRVRVEGVAVARGGIGGGIFLAEHDLGLFVEPAVIDDTVRGIAVGDRVEAAGFVTTGPGSLSLGDAVIRVTGTAAVPAAQPLPDAEGQRSDAEWSRLFEGLWRDALPVEVRMRIVSRIDGAGGSEILGATLVRNMAVRCFVPEAAPAAAVPGSQVSVRGVYRVTATDRAPSLPLPKAIDLWPGSAADITLLRGVPWWRRADVVKPLTATLAACLLAVAGTTAWIVLLRRQVVSRTRQLAAEIRSRRDGALEFEATLRERNRLAANLHDTLLQTLGGIGYQLDACEGSQAADAAEAQLHFDVARRMVNHAANELHTAVWAMRSLPIRDQTLPEAVRTICQRVGEGHAARIDVHADDSLTDVPEFVAGNLLLVIQEAVLNALRHGRAATIDVRVTDRPSERLIAVAVRDDGRGFDTATRQGVEQGHFGIQGMRERVERLGGTLAIESTPGRGTTVRARVLRHEFDADLAAGPTT
jgi:signal transduction histidine kinase